MWGISWDLEWRVSSFDINIGCAIYESGMNSPKLCHRLERLKNDIPKIFFLMNTNMYLLAYHR